MTEKQPPTPETTPDSATRRRFLGGAVGAVASVAGVSALSGVAAAHFPTRLDVDVQPDNAENFLDLNAHETVSVVVHSTEFVNSDGERETFDPTNRDVRYRFGSRFALEDGAGARPMNGGEVTTVGEGDSSQEVLTLTFPVEETGFDGGEETGWLYWERDESGEHGYSGVDALRVYGSVPSGGTVSEETVSNESVSNESVSNESTQTRSD